MSAEPQLISENDWKFLAGGKICNFPSKCVQMYSTQF